MVLLIKWLVRRQPGRDFRWGWFRRDGCLGFDGFLCDFYVFRRGRMLGFRRHKFMRFAGCLYQQGRIQVSSGFGWLARSAHQKPVFPSFQSAVEWLPCKLTGIQSGKDDEQKNITLPVLLSLVVPHSRIASPFPCVVALPSQEF